MRSEYPRLRKIGQTTSTRKLDSRVSRCDDVSPRKGKSEARYGPVCAAAAEAQKRVERAALAVGRKAAKDKDGVEQRREK